MTENVEELLEKMRRLTDLLKAGKPAITIDRFPHRSARKKLTRH